MTDERKVREAVLFALFAEMHANGHMPPDVDLRTLHKCMEADMSVSVHDIEHIRRRFDRHKRARMASEISDAEMCAIRKSDVETDKPYTLDDIPSEIPS